MAEVPTKAQAAKAAKEEQLAAEIRCRKVQLECADASISKLQQGLQSTRAKVPELGRFISHLAAFYEEVDKLAKGKSLFPATDMIVEGTNSIICDAKALIDGDVYVERLKEFVAAGDNPVYRHRRSQTASENKSQIPASPIPATSQPCPLPAPNQPHRPIPTSAVVHNNRENPQGTQK